MAKTAIIPKGIITDKTSVQKDAFNLLSILNSRKPSLIKKYGAKRIGDIANGLNALAKLTDTQVNDASKKNANLKLITIKAQEILRGENEDCLLGASQSGTPISKKINNRVDLVTSKQNQIAMAKKSLDSWKDYVKKFPKDKYANDKYKQALQNYNNVVAAYQNLNKIDSSKIDPNVWQYTAPVKTTNNKVSNPIPKENKGIMSEIQNYMPYIIMGGVVLMFLFSQTKPRTPVRK